jgi:hypothetical protein
MPAMIRKQVYLEPAQDKALKRLARRSRRPEAEIIRAALDLHMEEVARAERRKAAWREVDSFIGQRIAGGPVPGGRSWRRDDLYDRSPSQSR